MCNCQVGIIIGIERCDPIRVKHSIPVHIPFLIPRSNLDTRTTFVQICYKLFREKYAGKPSNLMIMIMDLAP